MTVHLPPPTSALGPAFEARAPERRETNPAFAQLLDASNTAPEAGPRQVLATRTQLSGEQAKQALAKAWEQRFGAPPSAATVGILTAQWAHETGGGERMYNYNFGGIKGTGPSGLTVAYRTREGAGDAQVRIVDNFRAYQSAEEGASDYIGLLGNRYPGALDAAQRGDPSGFVHELKARGYFSGDETLYTKSITRLAEQAVGPGVLSLGSGGQLPSSDALLRPAASDASGGGSAPLPELLNSYQVEAVVDEMSRAALRMAMSRGRRNFGDEM